MMIAVAHCLVVTVVATPGTVPAYVARFLEPLWMGVDFFFVLSGFFVGGLLLANRASPNLRRVFYSRRILRILPLYAVIVLGWLSATLISRDAPVESWEFHMLGERWLLPYLATFTQNFLVAVSAGGFAVTGQWLAPTWSICIEEHFYALAPFLLPRLSPAKLAVLMPCALVLLATVRAAFAALHPHASPWFYYTNTLLHCDGILIGIWLAALHAQSRLHSSLRSSQMGWAVVGGLGLVWAWQLGSATSGVMLVAQRMLDYLLAAGIAGLAVGHLLLAPKGALARVLSHRLLRWLGMRSYAIYLLHMPLLCIFHGVLRGTRPVVSDAQSVAIGLLTLGTTVLLAELSWRFLEGPLVSMGHRINYVPASASGAPAASSSVAASP